MPSLPDVTKCYGILQSLGYDYEAEKAKVAAEHAAMANDSMADAMKIPAHGPIGYPGAQGWNGVDYYKYQQHQYETGRLVHELLHLQSQQMSLLNQAIGQVMALRQQVDRMQLELAETRRELAAQRERERAAEIKADPFVVSTRRRVRKPT